MGDAHDRVTRSRHAARAAGLFPMDSVLTGWPVVFFWPMIVIGLILSALGLAWRRSSLPNTGAILMLPAAVYLSATPRFQFVGFVPVACLVLAAYTVRRDDDGSYAVPWNRVRIGWGFLAGAALFWIVLAVLVY